MFTLDELSSILAGLTDHKDISKLFDEILTEKEKKDLSLRWELMKKLNEGIPQRTISSELGISLCKITRGSRILKSDDSVIARILRKGE